MQNINRAGVTDHGGTPLFGEKNGGEDFFRLKQEGEFFLVEKKNNFFLVKQKGGEEFFQSKPPQKPRQGTPKILHLPLGFTANKCSSQIRI